MRVRTIGIALAAAVALLATDESWAAGRRSASRFSGAGASAARSGAFSRFSRPLPMTGAPTPFRHHGHSVFFIGGPFLFWSWPYGYYYLPPPYYYGPDYVAREALPPIYVEKFEGTPTPQTPGDIFCPRENAYYPDVKDCPNGWQRIIREGEPPADQAAG
ncbi:MAG: hypothetical protein ABR570_10665 [Burkholderiales bacterium]